MAAALAQLCQSYDPPRQLNLLAITLKLVFMTGVVRADSCVKGGVYCGSSLLNLAGSYRDLIVAVLQANGQITDETHVQNSMFDCLDAGALLYAGFCDNGCGWVASVEHADVCL